MTGPAPSPLRPHGRQVLPSFLGVGLLACAAFVVLAGSPIAPWWVTVPGVVGWLLCLGVTMLWFVRRPRVVLVAPAVLLVAWFVAVLAVA